MAKKVIVTSCRLDLQTRAKLDAIAEHDGIHVSDLLRMLAVAYTTAIERNAPTVGGDSTVELRESGGALRLPRPDATKQELLQLAEQASKKSVGLLSYSLKLLEMADRRGD